MNKRIVSMVALVGMLSAVATPPVFSASETPNDGSTMKSMVPLLKDKPPLANWTAANGSPRAVLLCLHELGMHSGLFDNLGTRMAAQNYTVYALDLRGFGGWKNVKGPEGRMSLERTLDDIKESVEALHSKYPGLPVFILGEAMGGALALQAASKFPDLIQGTISSAPGGDHYHGRHNYMRVCSHLLSSGPNKQFDMGKELISMATPRAAVREAIEKDPEVRLDLAPRELMACQFFMYKSKDMARRITSSPVLIVQGQKDGESVPDGANKVYEHLATNDKQMLALAEGDHYVYEDPKVSDVAFNGTLGWIEAHLSKDTAPKAKTGN
jgi:alpha-beta hydrolase superfamily lysophospholipase